MFYSRERERERKKEPQYPVDKITNKKEKSTERMHEKICGNELCSPKADQYLVFSLWVSYYPSLQF
jgi:hypothetical protein